MTDYKATLNLPRTAFPMRANLAEREPEALKRWAAENLYGRIRAARAGAPRGVMPRPNFRPRPWRPHATASSLRSAGVTRDRSPRPLP